MTPGQVAVALVPLPRCGAVDAAALPEVEQAHAARLLRGAGAYIALRAALRRLLGAALDCAPYDVGLQIAASGKPQLIPGQGPDLRFSLSHAEGLGAVALTVGREVGVDVERMTAGSTTAAARALGLPGAPAAEVLQSWCRAEAVAKAAACGLPAVLRGAVPPVSGGWRTRSLRVPPGWAGAVASSGGGWTVVPVEVPV